MIKKIMLACISIGIIISLLSVTQTIAQSIVRTASPYITNLVIPASGYTNNSISVVSSISNFDQIFPNTDPGAKSKGFGISSARIESNDQIKKNLGMFRSIKLYISMGDGSNEVLIASNPNISKNAGNNLGLNINKGVANNNTAGPNVTKKSFELDPNSTSSSVEQAILGRLPGVRIVSSGKPGAAPEVTIRGGSASILSAGPPLYIVDGVSVDNLQMLNPKDVESVDVLKDAAETAMYGLRGSNGVIVVKTKTGNPDSKKSSGSLDNFVSGTTIRLRFEYVLRYAQRVETGLNVNVNFISAAK